MLQKKACRSDQNFSGGEKKQKGSICSRTIQEFS